jgi:translation initiation factor 3 subunit M
MPAPSKTLLIEGSFTELAEEFAQYIDSVKRSQNDEGSSLSNEVSQPLSELAPLLRQEQEHGELSLSNEQHEQLAKGKTEVMKTLVTACPVLNSAPEKGSMPVNFPDAIIPH